MIKLRLDEMISALLTRVLYILIVGVIPIAMPSTFIYMTKYLGLVMAVVFI